MDKEMPHGCAEGCYSVAVVVMGLEEESVDP